jgi:hypothetical protein
MIQGFWTNLPEPCNSAGMASGITNKPKEGELKHRATGLPNQKKKTNEPKERNPL